MKQALLLFFALVILSQNLVKCMSLEEVKDDELVKLINQEQYVLVLFSKFPFTRIIL